MSGFATPFRVGLVVIAGVASFFVLVSFLGKQKYGEEATYLVTATFKDASGLGPKSRVQIAGIEVGVVDRIELTEDAQARAVLRIRKDVVLRRDARIVKRSASLLGDFLLDVFPGSPEQPALVSGAAIGRVMSQPGVEDVFAALGEVTRDIQGVTASLKDLLASDQVGSIKEIIRSVNEVAVGLNRTIERAGGRIDHILGNVEAVSGDLRGIARGQQATVQEILANVRDFTERANRVVASLDKIVGSGEGELKESVASVKATLADLQKTLADADAAMVSGKAAVDETRALIARVERGEGTVGRLLRDDGVAQKLDRVLGDVNAFVKPLADLQTHVHVREELHFAPGSGEGPKGKTIAQLRLEPRRGKVYGIEIVAEPRGRTRRSKLVTRRSPPAAGEVESQEEQVAVTTDEVKYSFFYGRRFGPALLRGGLVESSGGVGADLFALDDRLRFSVDAFDWANPDARFPRLRLSAQGLFAEHFYVGLGADDLLNGQVFSQGQRTVGRDLFVTGGLQFNDEDLKSLLTVVGAPVP